MTDTESRKLEHRLKEPADPSALFEQIKTRLQAGKTLYEFLPAIIDNYEDKRIRSLLDDARILDFKLYGWERDLELDERRLPSAPMALFYGRMHGFTSTSSQDIHVEEIVKRGRSAGNTYRSWVIYRGPQKIARIYNLRMEQPNIRRKIYGNLSNYSLTEQGIIWGLNVNRPSLAFSVAKGALMLEECQHRAVYLGITPRTYRLLSPQEAANG